MSDTKGKIESRKFFIEMKNGKDVSFSGEMITTVAGVCEMSGNHEMYRLYKTDGGIYVSWKVVTTLPVISANDTSPSVTLMNEIVLYTRMNLMNTNIKRFFGWNDIAKQFYRCLEECGYKCSSVMRIE